MCARMERLSRKMHNLLHSIKCSKFLCVPIGRLDAWANAPAVDKPQIIAAWVHPISTFDCRNAVQCSLRTGASVLSRRVCARPACGGAKMSLSLFHFGFHVRALLSRRASQMTFRLDGETKLLGSSNCKWRLLRCFPVVASGPIAERSSAMTSRKERRFPLNALFAGPTAKSQPIVH